MKSIISKLKTFWFDPAPAERLALLRIASGGFALWYLTSRFKMMERIVSSDSNFFEPVGLSSIFSYPMSPSLFMIILSVGIAFNIAFILGVKFNWTGPIFAIMLLFLLSYRNSWSMVYHNRIALVLHVLVIGFVSAADAISIDALLKTKKGLLRQISFHWRYGWPIKLICAATLLTYFLSGVAKLAGDLAWDWVSGSAMRSQVAIDAIRKDVLGDTGSVLFEWLYPYTWIFLIMGLLTFLLELGAPLAFSNKKTGMLWAILTWLMHWGIFFVMGIRFRYQMSGLIFLSFFEIEKPLEYLKKKLKFKGAEQVPVEEVNDSNAVVLFDGLCHFCDDTVRFIIKNDHNKKFHFAAQQSIVGLRWLKQYQAPVDISTIVLVDKGKVYTRSAAILKIMKHLKRPWCWLHIFRFTPKPIRELIYLLFSKYRYRWFGKKEQCEIPSAAIQNRFL